MKKLNLIAMTVITLGTLLLVTPSTAKADCSHGCGYVRPPTIFTGTNLQFRPFQPVRNTLRLGARVGVRTGRFLTGRTAFPGVRGF